MIRALPEPTRRRWQPLRTGFVDLFYYDTEEFFFRDGRLLLRGNNGTGKSKVLALTLPFLLDGALSSHRVEPDADPRKRMEWNLLLGGEHPYPERPGYTWLEFGRVDEHGESHFRTLGCGLKAVSGRGITRHWFFSTEQRVGAELRLVDATGTALTRDRLVDALGDRGTAYDRARDYRRAVDEALFGFGEQRYAALVDLLVALRQPQLSKRPSEKALSAALTEALPPLDQAVIADVAEAFRSLEEDRESVRAMTEAYTAARSFLGHYRRYAAIACRRKAALPRNAQAAYERINRELVTAYAAYAEAAEALVAARTKLTDLAADRERLRARDQALRAGPEMRSAHELERADTDARGLAARAQRLAGQRETAAGRVADRRDRHDSAANRQVSAGERLTDLRQSTVDSATAARIGRDHAERIDAALDDRPDLYRLTRDADQLADRQRRAIDHVGTLIAAVDDAARTLAERGRKVTELDAESAQLALRRTDADRAVSELGAQLVSAVRHHLSNAFELRVPDPAATLAELELWVETLDGANPSAIAASAAGQAAAGELARVDAELESRERAGRDRASGLATGIERLERGEDSAPPAPYTTDAAGRADRSGAPFWQLVDFAEHVAPEDRAGLEAALEAADILDAWVTPAGDVLVAGTEDVVLRPADRPADRPGDRAPTRLDTVLRPAVDRADPRAGAVADSTVADVLASVGVGEQGDTWVGADGRFHLGVLEGAWHKPVATYIGRGARAAARRARLAELHVELSTVESELAEIAAARTDLRGRGATLAAEVAAMPEDAALRQAHAQVMSLAGEHERLVARAATAASAVVAATAVHEGARTALEESARDVDLPARRDALFDVDASLGRYRIALAGLWPAVRAVADTARQAEQTGAALEEAESDLAGVADRAIEAGHQSSAAAERHETLRCTVGAAVAELQRRLAEVNQQLAANKAARATADHDRERAIGAQGRAEGRRDELSNELAEATEERAAAAEAFRRFTATGLLAVACPELSVPDPDEAWAPDPTVRLARSVNDELADVPADDQSWDRAQQRLDIECKSLSDTLSAQGNRAYAELREDGVLVHVEFRGRPATVPELTAALRTEVADRERLLNEREREILENHLVNEVASTLQELISAAEAQVGSMNDELERRPTSSGMRLRLSWRPRADGPAGLAAARERLLRQTADAWSEEDRAAVGGFLQAQIAEVRARDATGTWLEHMTQALDYRTWNQFVIQRYQNGQWKPAAGPASGGERVLAASVPLFAAASSHYASAGNPDAPRLVMLDEAFAGVDDNARAKYLGLLAAFDLDVVMTSEREWGCYPEVPGLAISHLSRVDGVAAVLVSNWEWDGSRRTRIDRTRHALAERPAEPATAEGLWD
ncbi:MAG: TIGR02680 family protein [Mycobacteriales bacterium]